MQKCLLTLLECHQISVKRINPKLTPYHSYWLATSVNPALIPLHILFLHKNLSVLKLRLGEVLTFRRISPGQKIGLEFFILFLCAQLGSLRWYREPALLSCHLSKCSLSKSIRNNICKQKNCHAILDRDRSRLRWSSRKKYQTQGSVQVTGEKNNWNL